MRSILLCGLLLIGSLAAFAQFPPQVQPSPAETSQPPAPEQQSGIVDLDTVVVSGAQPGPGMWKVSKGEHVLWILGTLTPLPKKMVWLSGDVERTIAQSQEVIAPPTVTMTSGLGVFRSMLLLPSLFKARKNPDGRTLQDMVSPSLYARWQVLKARYVGSDRGIEKWRPIFAAQELYEHAIRKTGLDQRSVVQPLVRKVARRHGIPVTPAEVKLVVEDPKSALKEFNRSALDDSACFAGTMARIETDLAGMRARANAWAVGDIATLRDLPFENQYVACLAAVTETGLARKLGIADLKDRVARTWLDAAEAALARNEVSFASLPITQLLKPDGYAEQLRARGYLVEAPQ